MSAGYSRPGVAFQTLILVLFLSCWGISDPSQNEIVFKRLTKALDYDASPSWSPKGDKIAFVSFSQGKGRLSILELGSVNKVTVLDTEGEISHPRWNPSGENVVFCWTREGKSAIHTYQMSNNRMLSLGIDGLEPCWSSDGTEIAYIHANRLCFWRWGDRSARRFEGDLLAPQNPCWMSEGNALLVQHAQAILLLGIPSGEMEELPKGDCVWAGLPAPTLEGDRVAFVGCSRNQYDLYVYQRSQKRLTRLTDDKYWYDSPSWSPDGTALVCQSDRMGRDELWVVGLDPGGVCSTITEEAKTQVLVPEIDKMPGPGLKEAADQKQETKPTEKPVAASGSNSGPDQAQDPGVDDFESGTAWTVQDWGDPATAALSEEVASEGRRSLKLSYEAIGKDKVAIRKDNVLDLSNRKRLLVDVYNDGPSCPMSLAICTGPQYVYFESESKKLAHGWNKDLSFDLNKPKFKCEASGWQYTSPLQNAETTLSLLLLFCGREKTGTFYLDRIRIE